MSSRGRDSMELKNKVGKIKVLVVQKDQRESCEKVSSEKIQEANKFN